MRHIRRASKLACFFKKISYLFFATGLFLIFNANFFLPLAHASGIIPPSNPPNNISPNPNFFQVCSENGQLDTSTACFVSTLAAIDNARAQEGVGPMILPANYLSLSVPDQLLAVTDAERVGRGLQPFIGLTQELNSAAQNGANSDSDPQVPLNYSWTVVGSNWAGGFPSVLATDYEWMYYDGYGSNNLDCSSPSAPGCWGHRDNILDPNYPCNPCTMGAAYAIGTQYSPSFATIMVGDNSGTSYSYTYSYQQIQSSLTPQPYITSISPSLIAANSSSTVTINGVNLTYTVEIQIDGQNITNFNQISDNEVSFKAPALPAGRYNITVITSGGETSYSENSLITYGTAPSQVTNLVATPGNSSVTLTWNAPSGGTAPTSYLITVYQGSTFVLSQTVNSSQNYAVIGGLQNGASYNFEVISQNQLGSSQPVTSTSVTPNDNLAPDVLMLTPSSGSILGGYQVTLIGAGFTNTQKVTFGSQSASFSVLGDGIISVSAPSVAQGGSVSVIVSTPNGTSPSTGPTFTYLNTDIYVPINPVRVVDTRPNSGYEDQNMTLGPGQTISAQLANIDGIPSNAEAVIANITVTNVTAPFDYLTIWPDGTSMPTVSNINFESGQTIANLQTLVLGSNDSVLIYNPSGSVDVIIDVEGYFVPASTTSNSGFYNSISPMRIVDTRSYTGNNYQDANQTLGPNGSITVTFNNVTSLPSSVSAVVLNVTATNTTASFGYLTVYPSSQSVPKTSNVNWSQAGETISNFVIVKVSSTDAITITNAFGDTDVVVDLYGYYTQNSTSGSTFYPVNPIRICDTRLNSSVVTACEGDTLGQESVLGVSIPNTMINSYLPTAISLNITVTNTTNWSYLTIYPANNVVPTSSNLNWLPSQTIANMTIVGLNNETFDVYNFSGYADFIADLQGLYLP